MLHVALDRGVFCNLDRGVGFLHVHDYVSPVYEFFLLLDLLLDLKEDCLN